MNPTSSNRTPPGPPALPKPPVNRAQRRALARDMVVRRKPGGPKASGEMIRAERRRLAAALKTAFNEEVEEVREKKVRDLGLTIAKKKLWTP